MNSNDILGLGKILPIEKLFDVLSNVFGKISKPYFDKKDIDTKAYEIKKLAEAKAEEMKIISAAVRENYLLTGGIEYKENNIAISSPKVPIPVTVHSNTLEERVKDRLDFKETKRQLNIESVTALAAEELKNELPVSNEPVKADWTTRFFSIVEEVSDEGMQLLWGKILSGEIKKPKSYSLRTLELLKNLTTDEAELFSRVANIKLVYGGDNFILDQDNGKFLKNEFGITFNDILLLTELGLVVSKDTLELKLDTTKEQRMDAIFYGNKVVVINRTKNSPPITIGALAFTRSGTELSKLIKQTHNTQYIQQLCMSLKSPSSTIQFGDFMTEADGRITLINLFDFE